MSIITDVMTFHGADEKKAKQFDTFQTQGKASDSGVIGGGAFELFSKGGSKCHDLIDEFIPVPQSETKTPGMLRGEFRNQSCAHKKESLLPILRTYSGTIIKQKQRFAPFFLRKIFKLRIKTDPAAFFQKIKPPGNKFSLKEHFFPFRPDSFNSQFLLTDR